MDKTNSEWKAKSKVVLDYKLRHTNKELDERVTYQREHQGAFEGGRPAGLGRLAWGPRYSS
jgi:hypothetical protein